MPFPRNLLLENEEIAIDMRPHWWMLVPASLFAVAVMLGSIWALDTIDGRGPTKIITLLLGAVFLITIIGILSTFLTWTNTNFVVTSERIVYRTGIFAKKAKEIPLDRVENLAFKQTIFERIIGSGDLTVESAGETGNETFHNMRRPNVMQFEIYRQIEALQERDARRNASFVSQGIAQGNAVESIPDQIHKLDELRQRGLLTDEEFEAKKHDLLDRM